MVSKKSERDATLRERRLCLDTSKMPPPRSVSLGLEAEESDDDDS